LGHAVSRTIQLSNRSHITLVEANTVFSKGATISLRDTIVALDEENFVRGESKEVATVDQLIFLGDGDDLHSELILQEAGEVEVLLDLLVVGGGGGAADEGGTLGVDVQLSDGGGGTGGAFDGSLVDVTRSVVGRTRRSIDSSLQHDCQLAVDDVEVRVKMHLFLIAVVVLDDDDVLAAEAVIVKELINRIHVRSQTSSDEGVLAGRDEVTTFKGTRGLDGVDGGLTDGFKNSLDDVCFELTLFGGKASENTTSICGDGLISHV